jgi:Tfp pilus assembly protein PilV
MLILDATLARLRDRSGFTLIETLVAMVTGVVVTGALFTILAVSARQSSHLSNSAAATTAGRSAMNRLVDALHSACIEKGFAPVKKGSTSTTLIFVSGYDQKPIEETPGTKKGSSTEEPPSELTENDIYKDVVEYKAAPEEKLVDKRYTANTTAQTSGEYAFKEYATYTLTNVAPAEVNGAAVPVFRYYPYNTVASTTTSTAASTLNATPLGTPLTAATAAQVAGVAVAFRAAAPTTEYKLSSSPLKGTYAEFSTLTTFAFMAPNSEASIVAKPCE